MSQYSGQRRARFQASRSTDSLVFDQWLEVPGRPNVVYMVKNYHSHSSASAMALEARQELPFLFKAFETGQIGPKRMAKISGGKPRMATIHEYLDWTVTGAKAEEDDELDFGGFVVVLLYPRWRSLWPPPSSAPVADEDDRKQAAPGAVGRPPLPALNVHSRPVSAATIRFGPGFVEVPFVATKDTHRGRGYGRALLDAIENIARASGVSKLLLCSTNDPVTQATWHHMGFVDTSESDMQQWGFTHSDLLHMENTTQMHKHLGPPQRWKPVLLKHEAFRQRLYVPLGGGSQQASSKRQATVPARTPTPAPDSMPAAAEAPAAAVDQAEQQQPLPPPPPPPPQEQQQHEQEQKEEAAQPSGQAVHAEPGLPGRSSPPPASAAAADASTSAPASAEARPAAQLQQQPPGEPYGVPPPPVNHQQHSHSHQPLHSQSHHHSQQPYQDAGPRWLPPPHAQPQMSVRTVAPREVQQGDGWQ